MYRLVTAAVIIVFVGVNAILFSNKDKLFSSNSIKLKTAQTEYELEVELARTAEEKRLGLMNRDNLEEEEGMLFVYDQPIMPSFWMKNMLISIDMLFIGEDLKIKHISHNVPPCSQDEKCPTYSSLVPVQYVLEVASGYTKKHQIAEGDQLILGDVLAE